MQPLRPVTDTHKSPSAQSDCGRSVLQQTEHTGLAILQASEAKPTAPRTDAAPHHRSTALDGTHTRRLMTCRRVPHRHDVASCWASWERGGPRLRRRVDEEDQPIDSGCRTTSGPSPRRGGGRLTVPSPAVGPEHPRVGGEDLNEIEPGVTVIGTPPRQRGGRAVAVLDVIEDRNTPASAGTTRTDLRAPPLAPEHPRVGGEDGGGPFQIHAQRGTPPRRRGGPPQRGQLLRLHRNTPASAGRTVRGAVTAMMFSEHPRVGGEDFRISLGDQWADGTPPRRRGGRHPLASESGSSRNTPASAGRTPSRPARPWRAPERPRVGGEDAAPGLRASRMFGTPPRRRGGRGQWGSR